MQLESLYQDIILDHYKHPRGRGVIAHAAGESHQVNPTCGDEVTVQVALDHRVCDGRAVGRAMDELEVVLNGEMVTEIRAGRHTG